MEVTYVVQTLNLSCNNVCENAHIIVLAIKKSATGGHHTLSGGEKKKKKKQKEKIILPCKSEEKLGVLG
jgi:hypothetical protein